MIIDGSTIHTIIKNIPEIKFHILLIEWTPIYIESKYTTNAKIRKIFNEYSLLIKSGYTANVKAAHIPAVFPTMFWPKKYKATIVNKLNANSIQQKNVVVDEIKFTDKPNLVRIWIWEAGREDGIVIGCLNKKPKTRVPINKNIKIGELIAKFFL